VCMSFGVCTEMVQVWGAGRGSLQPLARNAQGKPLGRNSRGKPLAKGARGEPFAERARGKPFAKGAQDKPRMDTDEHGRGETEMEKLRWESSRDWGRPTRDRVADGYSGVNSEVSIRNDFHSLPALPTLPTGRQAAGRGQAGSIGMGRGRLR